MLAGQVGGRGRPSGPQVRLHSLLLVELKQPQHEGHQRPRQLQWRRRPRGLCHPLRHHLPLQHHQEHHQVQHQEYHQVERTEKKKVNHHFTKFKKKRNFAAISLRFLPVYASLCVTRKFIRCHLHH